MSLDAHRHKKQFGQHFLRDASVVERIVLAVDPQPGDRIVEIGPGAGALTFPMLHRHGRLTAIEFDRDLIAPLGEAARAHGQLEVIQADVLDVDLGALADGGTLRMVGNLPYNISSPILFHCLAHAGSIRDMHFMLQKEVIDRMAAGPGSKVYGRLSVMLQAFARVTPLFLVPPEAFDPPPKVDSAVVRVVPLPAAEVRVQERAVFARVVREAFAQRRKTLRNALSGSATPEAMQAVGIDPSLRAEAVPVEGFIALANSLGHAADGITA